MESKDSLSRTAWTLQGYSVGGQFCGLSTAGILCRGALQGYSAVGQWWDTLRLGTPGYSAIGFSTAGDYR